jgi:hypothetical protein
VNSAALNALYRILNSSELARLGCAIQAKVASRLKDSRWGVLSGCRLTRASELILLSRITKDLEGFIENEVSYGIGRCGFVALVAFLIWVLRK